MEKPQTNKMILKHFLPAIIALAIMFAGAFSFIGYKIHRDSKTPNGVNLRTALSPIVVLYALILMIIPLISTYRKTKKFAAHAAREYITIAMKTYPELKQFQQVLTDKKSLNYLATIISNELNERPSERKLISDTIFKMNLQLPLPKEKEVALIRKTLNEVIEVIQGHEMVDQERFITKIYMEMARADMMYIFKPKRTEKNI